MASRRQMMERSAMAQRDLSGMEWRLDYLALAPAAASLCYPFLLRAFQALVGPPGATPAPSAIASAALILAIAFAVPFLGLVLALRPAATAGARRLAYVSVTAPTLYVFLGVVQALARSPVPDELVWAAIWLALAAWSQHTTQRVAGANPLVGRWRVIHGVT